MPVSVQQCKVMAVDDDQLVLESLGEILADIGVQTRLTVTASEALAVARTFVPDVVLIDLRMPDCDGIELMQSIRDENPLTLCVVMTGHSSIDSAVMAIKAGAYDYMAKPFGRAEVEVLLQRVMSHLRLTIENLALREQRKTSRGMHGLIGASATMDQVYVLISKVAQTQAPVLVTGESGTGKELVARAIHRMGPRSAGPFIAVDCGAISPTLIESELFGHTKGAFTGADKSRTGMFEAAQEGTLFLDEIGELPLEMQAKLLRVLQEREVRPVGAVHTRALDVRIVAATNRDLGAAVRAKEFREDLYFRLNVLAIRVPPLRERRQDVALLARTFLQRATSGRRESVRLSPAALEVLEKYEWPGNVRELQNCMERVALLCEGAEIRPTDLLLDRTFGSRTSSADGSLVKPLAEIEREAILATFEATGRNIARAAKILKIGKTTLYRKISEYGVSLVGIQDQPSPDEYDGAGASPVRD